MTKKIVCILLSVVFSVLCAVTAFAIEDIMLVGDEVRLVFSIGSVRNVAGVSVEAIYNSEYLTAENIVCNVGGNESNIANLGEVKWNFLVYNGVDFNNDDVAVVTFKVLKRCTVKDLGIEYNCSECFNSDLQKISDNPNSLFTVRAVHSDIEYNVNKIGSENNINSGSGKLHSDIPNIENTTDSDTNNTVSTVSSTNKTADTDELNTTNITTDIDKPTKTTKTTDTDKTKISNNTADTDKTKNTDSGKSANRDAEKSADTVKNNFNNNVTRSVSYSQNTNNTSVDTSDSRNFTVMFFLLTLSFLVMSLSIKDLREK